MQMIVTIPINPSVIFPPSFMTPSSLELQTRREAGYLKSAATLSMSLTVLSDQTSGSCFREFVVTNCG